MSAHAYAVHELVCDIARLSGQTVTVRGVLTVRRENHSISDTGQSTEARLWVHFHHATLGTRERDVQKFDGRSVVATGTLDAVRKGHMNRFSGTITIRRLIFEDSDVI